MKSLLLALLTLLSATGAFAKGPGKTPAKPKIPAPAPKNWVDFVSQRGPTITAELTAGLHARLPDYKSLLPAVREGLMDEAVETPASAPACALAEKLCNAWLAALAERQDRFASVGHTAPPSTDFKSEKKQTLKPDDILMYLREEDDARKKKADDKQLANYFGDAQKKAWADRCAVLHQGLDNLYSQFRAARRQALTPKS